MSQTVSTVFLNRFHHDNKHRTSFHMIYDNLFYHTSFYENRFTLASLANPKAFDILFASLHSNSPIANLRMTSASLEIMGERILVSTRRLVDYFTKKSI